MPCSVPSTPVWIAIPREIDTRPGKPVSGVLPALNCQPLLDPLPGVNNAGAGRWDGLGVLR